MRLPPLVVSESDRAELERRVRCRTVEARVAQRARIVLLAAEGRSNVEIGELWGCTTTRSRCGAGAMR